MKKASRNVDFYGRDFIITPDVLIPRPETEMMIDAVLNLVGKPYLPGVKASEAQLPEDLAIVDVGTGSGCIGITLKLELPKSTIYAVDISDEALDIARQNARKHNVEGSVSILKSDLLSDTFFYSDTVGEIASEPKGCHDSVPRIDVVVANLPYVDENWEWLDKEQLSREPALALYAGDGGLALIKKLIDQVEVLGVPYLILEADPCQHERIICYAKEKGLELAETRGFVLTLKAI